MNQNFGLSSMLSFLIPRPIDLGFSNLTIRNQIRDLTEDLSLPKIGLFFSLFFVLILILLPDSSWLKKII